MQIRKQQLELDMERQTGSKKEKEYINAIWTSLVAQTVKRLSTMQETWVPSLGREDPLEKGQAPHSSILRLPSGSAGKESAFSAGDLGSIPGLGRSLEKGMTPPLQ